MNKEILKNIQHFFGKENLKKKRIKKEEKKIVINYKKKQKN